MKYLLKPSVWLIVFFFVCTAIIFGVLFQTHSGIRPDLALELQGENQSRTKATLSWDTGGGFTEYERKPVLLGAGDNSSAGEESAQAATRYLKQVPLPQRPTRSLVLTSDGGGPLNISRVSLLEVAPLKDGETPHRRTKPKRRLIWTQAVSPDQARIVIDHPALSELRHSSNLTIYQVGGAAILALMATAVLAGLLGLGAYRRDDLRNRPWVFWVMFCVGAVYFTLWCLGQWPGFPSGDTYDQLMQRLSATFSNWNPFPHTLMLNVLNDLTGSVGAVTVIQALASAWVGSYGLYSLYRRGCPLSIVLLFAGLFITYPVVAIYNLQPWRDIIFSLGMVFWMLIIFCRGLDRRYFGVVVHDDLATLLALGMALFLVASVRHNGIVFLIAIPLLLVLGGGMRLRSIAVLTSTAAVIYFAVMGVLATALGVHKHTNYDEIKLSIQMQPIAGILTSRGGYKSPNPAADHAAVARLIDPEVLKRDYLATSVLPLYIKWRNPPQGSPEYKEMTSAYWRLVLNNPEIFLAERTHLFLASIGFRTWGFASAIRNPGQVERAYYEGAWWDNFGSFVFSPVLPSLTAWQDKILQASVTGPGWTNRYLLYFTAFPGLCLLSVILVAWARLPITALASLVIAIQMVGLYLTGIASDFRFFYFLLLFEFFAIPMVVTEWRAQKRSAR